MEGVDEYRPPQEKHLSRELPAITPEQIALQALIDNLTKEPECPND